MAEILKSLKDNLKLILKNRYWVGRNYDFLCLGKTDSQALAKDWQFIGRQLPHA